jgi:hypothetical protein
LAPRANTPDGSWIPTAPEGASLNAGAGWPRGRRARRGPLDLDRRGSGRRTASLLEREPHQGVVAPVEREPVAQASGEALDLGALPQPLERRRSAGFGRNHGVGDAFDPERKARIGGRVVLIRGARPSCQRGENHREPEDPRHEPRHVTIARAHQKLPFSSKRPV